ncbi:chromosome segregation ATPase [Herbaspirillum seropedicae]|uniref:hypothetical protein n=1 Tax=Herbaspirillum seropedicae TaxID=964 RepID=UPI003399366C
MSNVVLKLALGATPTQPQISTADNDPGGNVADQVAAIMKKIGKLQKEAAALQGPPEEVAKMRKAIEQEIRALELKMQEMLRQQTRNQAQAPSAGAAAGDDAARQGNPVSGRRSQSSGGRIDEIV